MTYCREQQDAMVGKKKLQEQAERIEEQGAQYRRQGKKD